jgi:hypothetical protein
VYCFAQMGEPTPEGGIIALQQGSFVPPIHSQHDENGGDDAGDDNNNNNMKVVGASGAADAGNAGMNTQSMSNRGIPTTSAGTAIAVDSIWLRVDVGCTSDLLVLLWL